MGLNAWLTRRWMSCAWRAASSTEASGPLVGPLSWTRASHCCLRGVLKEPKAMLAIPNARCISSVGAEMRVWTWDVYAKNSSASRRIARAVYNCSEASCRRAMSSTRAASSACNAMSAPCGVAPKPSMSVASHTARALE